ncbi:MAG: type II secretion system protein GspD, partial [Pirellulaceae bacterium]
WEENGGTGRMRPFPATLSLIITQTQENQDRIQNLLTRLRELNDVQIVVEVRFIRLRDDFFERVGIDFDFQINDNSGLTATTLPDNVSDGFGGRTVIGRAPISDAFLPTGDLDIPVFQNSFGSTLPAFGGDAAGTALNFGFAILSDIEVFFLLQAAKGDERSNVTQAPTVTMFNGQSASVFDGSQQPFVTSIQPVVGDFAAAQQPIITILPEGTQLNVRAVASADRRFVRMTLVPFFSQVTDVQEFTFDGTRSVRRGGGTDLEDILDAIGGNPGDPLGNDEIEITESGTTVQLPVFANTTITTTVSVPDGGTVLLGGIKEMSETRVERGVPFLSNVPYINRLFKNVGIGRETNSLMMMVTPRIIIQEEEEARQVNTGN